MKVLLVAPTVPPARTGNARTAERWARGLEARGHACRVVASEALPGALDEGPWDVVHLHHAVTSGRFVDEARARAAVVVSFAGTDLAALPAGPGAAVALRAA